MGRPHAHGSTGGKGPPALWTWSRRVCWALPYTHRRWSPSKETLFPQLESTVMPYLQVLSEFREGVRSIARERRGEAPRRASCLDGPPVPRAGRACGGRAVSLASAHQAQAPRPQASQPRRPDTRGPCRQGGRVGPGARRPAPLAACCLWDAVLRLACLRAEGWRQPCCCRTRLRGDCRPLPGEVVLGASLSALSQPPRAFTRPGDSGSAGSAWLLNRQQVASARRSASSAARCELTSDQGSQNGTCPVGGQASCCPHRAPLVLTIQQKVEALPRTTRGQWQTPSGRRLVCHTPPGPSVTRSHTWRS